MGDWQDVSIDSHVGWISNADFSQQLMNFTHFHINAIHIVCGFFFLFLFPEFLLLFGLKREIRKGERERGAGAMVKWMLGIWLIGSGGGRNGLFGFQLVCCVSRWRRTSWSMLLSVCMSIPRALATLLISRPKDFSNWIKSISSPIEQTLW